jgi:hypothetical protein
MPYLNNTFTETHSRMLNVFLFSLLLWHTNTYLKVRILVKSTQRNRIRKQISCSKQFHGIFKNTPFMSVARNSHRCWRQMKIEFLCSIRITRVKETMEKLFSKTYGLWAHVFKHRHKPRTLPSLTVAWQLKIWPMEILGLLIFRIHCIYSIN